MTIIQYWAAAICCGTERHRIWLDYPRRVIMPRVLRRSVRRAVTREVLFGGNRETWRGWPSREHPAWWAWSQHGSRHREVEHRVNDPRLAPLDTLRFTDPADTEAWLTGLRAPHAQEG